LLWKFKARDEIWGVDISADGRYIVAGSRDNAFYLLNSIGELLSKYTTKYFVSSVAISATGEYSVAGSYDNNIYYFVKTSVRPPKPTYPKIVALKTTVDRIIMEGDTTTVEVTLQNIGDGVARNIKLTDIIPEGLELVEGNTTWTGELDPGGVEVVSYKIRAGALPVRENVTYELPGVNVTYEDSRGVFYSFTGASILLTVTPKAPVEKPSPGIGERVSAFLGKMAEGKEKLYLPVLGALLILIGVAMAVMRRKRERAVRRERVMLLRKIKGEITTKSVSLKDRRPGIGSFIPTRKGYQAYKRETINFLRRIKAMVRSGERPSEIRTFPEKPGGSVFTAAPYWLRNIVTRKEKKTIREKNVALLEDIKKTIG